MFDHDHRIPNLNQRMQHFQKFADIFEMQAGSRFIQNIERLACRPAGQFLGELNALGLSPRQGGGRLSDMDIAQPDPLQHSELFAD